VVQGIHLGLSGGWWGGFVKETNRGMKKKDGGREDNHSQGS
jgi:hypothetical protein